ncbi:MAG TPA: hypothetical protein GXZ95_03890 [Mollicutes bacterium]|nr:hypothetical protein [Mollicutes bacterium]
MITTVHLPQTRIYLPELDVTSNVRLDADITLQVKFLDEVLASNDKRKAIDDFIASNNLPTGYIHNDDINFQIMNIVDGTIYNYLYGEHDIDKELEITIMEAIEIVLHKDLLPQHKIKLVELYQSLE